MTIIYRLSDTGYKKEKPSYINNENCLRNALSVFPQEKHNWIIICDNVGEHTIHMMEKYYHGLCISTTKGNGAETFNVALDEALKLNDNEIVYFIENDYIHQYHNDKLLLEGFELGADYMTLYLHPDKFLPPSQGGNPNVSEDGGYLTKIYLGSNGNLFGWFDSTTMTFAAKVKTLKQDEKILRYHTSGTHPNDYPMFISLREKGKVLLCPLHNGSTHGETRWLAPLEINEKTIEYRWEELLKYNTKSIK